MSYTWSVATKPQAIEEYNLRIEKTWADRGVKTLWLDLERDLVDILGDDRVSDTDKVYLAKLTINAHTRRGHFINN